MMDDFKPYATVWYEQHQLAQHELDALRNLVDYTLANEADHYQEFVSNGGNPTDHVYSSAIILQELVK
jgi:hypothetical protein